MNLIHRGAIRVPTRLGDTLSDSADKVCALLTGSFSGRLRVFLVAFALVCSWNFGYLRLSWESDDYGWLNAVRPSDNPLHYWLPTWGWFYRPVFLLYFWVGRHLWGAHPLTFHLAGLALHTLCILLLVSLTYRLTRRAGLSALAGVVFCLWPGKGQAIWWISSASTLLCSVFYLLTLHCWLTWRTTTLRRYYLLSLLCFLLCLCAKEDSHSLPPALILFDCFFFPAVPLGRRLLSVAPLVLIAAGYCGCDIIAYNVFAAHEARARLWSHALVSRLDFALRFGNQLLLNVFESDWVPLTLGGLLLFFLAVCRNRAFRFFTLWSLVAALPSPLETGIHAMTERFAYLPLLPLSILLAQLGFFLYPQRRRYFPLLIALLLIRIVPLHLDWSDPINLGFLMLACLAIIAVVSKVFGLDWRILASAAIVMLCSQLRIYLDSGGFWGLWQTLAAACCIVIYARDAWPVGLLLALFSWPAPAAYFLFYALASLAFSPKKLRLGTRRSVEKENAV